MYNSAVYSFHRFSQFSFPNFVYCFLGSTVAITIVEVPVHSLYHHHCHCHSYHRPIQVTFCQYPGLILHHFTVSHPNRHQTCLLPDLLYLNLSHFE